MFDPLSRVEVTVACRQSLHRIEWNGTSLETGDHDLEVEMVHAGLGGKFPYCIEVFDAWSEFRVDRTNSRFLTGLFFPYLLSDAALDHLKARYEFLFAKGVSPFLKVTQVGSVSLTERYKAARVFVVLNSLPDNIKIRLAADLFLRFDAAWGNASFRKDTFPNMEFLVDLVGSHEFQKIQVPGVPHINWTLSQNQGGAETSPLPYVPGGFAIKLPPRWLADVWMRNLAVVSDSFIVDIGKLEETEGGWTAITSRLCWDSEGPRIANATMHLPSDGPPELNREV